MEFTVQQYEEKKEYLEGMFSLGGLSECGKTSAGLYLQSIGIKRMKIIQIEQEMMEERGYNISDGMKDEHFIELYAKNTEEVFKEFLFRLISKLQENEEKYASIESLYRAELGVFLKRELGAKMLNIYIEAPIEVRAKREMEKVNTKLQMEGKEGISFEEMLKKVKEKDLFKLKHGADHVKEIADIIINNNEYIDKYEFDKIVNGIAHIIYK